MDELYTESFFSRSSEVAVLDEKPQAVEETQIQVPTEKPVVEIYEITNQMGYYLDQLEKSLFDEFSNFADFEFIIKEIREQLSEKNLNGIYGRLSDLEELLDLS